MPKVDLPDSQTESNREGERAIGSIFRQLLGMPSRRVYFLLKLLLSSAMTVLLENKLPETDPFL